VPLLALAVYGAYGSPQLPAQPLSVRLDARQQQLDFASAVARVEAHLATHPADGRGWEVLAPVYSRAGRFGEAAKAYEAAIRLLGESSPRLTAYGEALVSAQDGVVPAEARAAFEKALALDPATVKASFYLAQAAEQDADAAKARSYYMEIVARSPADAPWLPMVRERLSKLPGGDGAASVASLPAQDREAVIRGMVEGLAARLHDNGGTAEEWSRLVRSYAVLGERAKAQSALDKARQTVAANGVGREALDAVARDLKLDPIEARR
jgi:cytochrome c-type biogenesis protein CcmH